MNAKKIKHLMPALRVAVNPYKRKIRDSRGAGSRPDIYAQTVTELIKFERLKPKNIYYLDEVRGYAERLISEAIRHGDKHGPTMELANFWIREKELIHKLFKVIAPRLESSKVSYTMLHTAPRKGYYTTGILELRGNPFPPLNTFTEPKHNWLHNILLQEANKEYQKKKIIDEEKAAAQEDLEEMEN